MQQTLSEDIMLVYNSVFHNYQLKTILSDSLKLFIEEDYGVINLLHICKPERFYNRFKRRIDYKTKTANMIDWEKDVLDVGLAGYVVHTDGNVVLCKTCRTIVPNSLYTAFLMFKNKDKLKI